MARAKEQNGSPPGFDSLQQEQLRIYAVELSRLYGLLRSKSEAWLEAEKQLRRRGTYAETIHQVLAAALTVSQLALEPSVSPQARRHAAQRLPRILERGLEVMQEYRRELGPHGQHDLGLASLLRDELFRLASERGWDVEVDTETVHPWSLSETTAYLIVWESLQHMAENPCTRKVALSLAASNGSLVVRLVAYHAGSNDNQKRDSIPFLTRLYARLASGTCRWRTIPNPGHGFTSASEVELTLPLRSVGESNGYLPGGPE